MIIVPLVLGHTFIYNLTWRGEKDFQFNLPYMLLCGEKKVNYPFNYEVLELLDKLLSSFFAPK